jgi:hypothetical protein
MNRLVGTLAAATLALALATTPSSAAAPEKHPDCFPADGSWQSWSAADNGDVLYLRVFINDIYRVDLTPGSHAYRRPDYFLVNEVRGSNWICRAVDLDLTMASSYGYRRPLIAVSMRKLTPAEVAAIPREDLPR